MLGYLLGFFITKCIIGATSEVKRHHYLPYCSVPIELTYTLVETMKTTSSEGQHKRLYPFEGFYNNIYPIRIAGLPFLDPARIPTSPP